MSQVTGVRGPIEAEDLGVTLCHEHVVVASPGVVSERAAIGGDWNDIHAAGVAALLDAKAGGLATIVDCTTFDLGRDPELLTQVAKETGVNIIAATGLWLDPSATLRNRTTDELAAWFLRDLQEGIGSSGVRAGVIKIANETSGDEISMRILEAVAGAWHRCPAPIITHTNALRRTGLEQTAMFQELGVAPGAVAIGHSDDSDDLDYLLELARRGFYVAMDRIPNGDLAEYGGQNVEDRVSMIAALIEQGSADRILLGHDDPVSSPLLSTRDAQRHKQNNPLGLSFIFDVVIPGLKKRGYGQDIFDLLLVHNPKQWLCLERL